MYKVGQKVRIKNLYEIGDGNGEIVGKALRKGYWRVRTEDMVIDIETHRLFDMDQWVSLDRCHRNLMSIRVKKDN